MVGVRSSSAEVWAFRILRLARKAGLDPTIFNKSKCVTREGKLRWPSIESISKILNAKGASLNWFVSYGRKAGELVLIETFH